METMENDTQHGIPNLVPKVFLFILIANVIGTNVFIPHYFTLEFAFTIWTWSLFANIVFIITMTLSLIIPLKLHAKKGSIFINGLICGGLVYFGYMISWFFVCNLSDEFSMDDYTIVYHGYWGALACMITSMIMMAKTDPNYIDSKQKNYVKCPYCNKSFRVPKTYTGKANCTGCNSEFRVVSAHGVSVAVFLDAKLPAPVKHSE